MSFANLTPTPPRGCCGNCQQGRRQCDCRYDGTSRSTQPGELLPNPPDPAEGQSLRSAFRKALPDLALAASAVLLAVASALFLANSVGAL